MIKVLIDSQGRIKYLHSDEMNSLRERLGSFTIRRASNVDPDEAGNWYADLAPVEGPHLGSFDTRAEALGAEAEWLLDKGYPVPGEARNDQTA